ncbi:mRNA capping enzyme small subunit [Mythimna separata entomopoxvirus 'L']|uniref:mRNA capping enzyme small subunit n=1 Tax=Mythimna separata entomopoxvirus 'L' TaxID=1293572 RepID=A0A916KQ88_9POXV|nr:mRNA capping enzyme small subunit [Mythimna separata entomopoxvirus 'L']CCU56313.1 mRNA capping enzyme small subunit [Mythimna separata entomopoxvirus 'L']
MLDITKDLISSGISIKVPNVNIIQNIKPNYNNDSSPKAYFSIIYHSLAIVIEIQDTYKLNDNIEYFSKYDDLQKKNKTDYDFSYNNLFKTEFKLEKSGSSMKNWTNIYNTTDVTLDILSPLYKKYDKVSIRLPCVISTSVIHFVYILSYIYNSVTLVKEDLWLNDSFIVICEDLRKNNYNDVKNQIKTIVFNEKTRQYKIDGLFKNFMIDDSFRYIIGEFINDIASIVCDLWLTVQSNIQKSSSDRKKIIWDEYDNVLNIFIKKN